MTPAQHSPGLAGVIAGETAICKNSGGLRYRGYAIEDLAEKARFEEVAFLILHGHLPTKTELAAFEQRLREAASVAPPIIDLLRSIPTAVSMMDVMRTGASLLSHWDPEASDNCRAANFRKAERLLAQLPVVMAARHRLRNNLEPLEYLPDLSLAGNILHSINGGVPDKADVRAMDVSLIIYAEHEYNASTFTARVVCSTLSDIHSSITAAIGALKGPLHGGANERVMKVLQEVGSADRAEAWIRDALSRKIRIMGFGHRVYKLGDPRAKFLKPLCSVLARRGGHEEMERMADTIEATVMEEKRLRPNVDWPSARLYHYLGLPVDLYTPLFVLSRIVGWSAHVIEQLDNNRLIRPMSIYTGPDEQTFVPLEER